MGLGGSKEVCLSPHSLDPLACVPYSMHSTPLHRTEAHGSPGGQGAVPLLHSELPQCFTLYWPSSGAGGPARTAPSWSVSGGGSPGLQPYHFHLAICTHLVQALLHTELMCSGEP